MTGRIALHVFCGVGEVQATGSATAEAGTLNLGDV